MTITWWITMVLSMALLLCLLPREVWSALPGGMPYYMVKAVEDQPAGS